MALGISIGGPTATEARPLRLGPTANPRVARAGAAAALVAAAAVCAALGGLVLLHRVPWNRDCAMHAEIGRAMLQGKLLYVDRIDVNPPLVFYLYAAVAYLSRVIGSDLGQTFHLLVWVLVIYSVAGLRMLSRPDRSTSAAGSWLIVAAWLSFSLMVLTSVDFGQREHLFMLGYVPWLYARERRHAGSGVPWGVALAFGLIGTPVLLLKPHYLLLAAVLECWMLYRSRRWSSLRSLDLYVFGLGLAAYLAHFAFLPAAMQEAYFGRWLPFIAANYSGYNCAASDLAWRRLGSGRRRRGTGRSSDSPLGPICLALALRDIVLGGPSGDRHICNSAQRVGLSPVPSVGIPRITGCDAACRSV